MIPCSRHTLSDFYTLSQTILLENQTLHSGTYLYTPYMEVATHVVRALSIIKFSQNEQLDALCIIYSCKMNLDVSLIYFANYYPAVVIIGTCMIVSFFIIFSKKRTFINKVAGKRQRNRHNASFDFMINQREGGAGISI